MPRNTRVATMPGPVRFDIDLVPSKTSPIESVRNMRLQLLRNIYTQKAVPLSVRMQAFARRNYGWDDQPAKLHNAQRGYPFGHAGEQITSTASLDLGSDTITIAIFHPQKTVQHVRGRPIYYGGILEADLGGKGFNILAQTEEQFLDDFVDILQGAAAGVRFTGVQPATRPRKSGFS